MLFLTGLMGLMAVSAVAYIDLFGEEEEEEGPLAHQDQAGSGGTAVTDLLVAAEPALEAGAETADQHAALWPPIDSPAEITEFDAERDALLYVWDDSAGNTLAPEVDLRTDLAHDDRVQIWSGSTLVATVSSQGQRLDDLALTLMPQSAVAASGLTTGG